MSNRKKWCFQIPLQPEFKMKTAYYIEKREFDQKRNKSYLYYQFKCHSISSSMIVIPDGSIDILFTCVPQTPYGKICGSVLRSKEIQLTPGAEYFGVRFPLGRESLKWNCSMKDIVECEMPIKDILSLDDPAHQLAILPSFEGRIQRFQETIGTLFLNEDRCSPIVMNALYNIHLSKGNITMNDLAQRLGFSTRYVRKQLEQDIGISPKLFSQIARFQCSLSMLMSDNNYSIWDIIEESGYYDQAHLINEYKKFSYYSPRKLMDTITKGKALVM
ncbi:helix-turn-helix domain-containing protein [Priestia filamentosa]|uniref:helix-turn-helix domain-containing protein n=1 Tax=Priestia filamentosa TaxID=1402861 RepID=UPI002E1BBAC7|nr:helix-turn-helix domain-containing protein [Priestia filamentosa]MED3727530.1 helix-turn-helix domain-containing protein [Priestia filamentosa]